MTLICYLLGGSNEHYFKNNGVCKVTNEHFTKIRSYAEYSKVKINSYTNTSSIYNITVITSGELKITFEPNSTVDASSPYYIEGTISL